ncbi:MAG: hypothetical protein Q7V62_08340, partial [Actinomycetota bacterium]|nr:hypothetical protein [Actinomycetota bacterium]
LTASGASPTYVEGSSTPADLFSGVSVSTVDAGQTITSLQLTVAGLADGTNEKLTVDGTEFSLVDGATGTAGAGYSYTVSVVGATATVTITRPSGSVSTDAAQTLVDGLGYRNTSSAPTGADRTVTLTQIVDSGSSTLPSHNSTTLAVASIVGIQLTNDAPVLADTGLPTLTVAEDVGPPANGSTAGSMLVSSLVGGMSDVDGTLQGIAIAGSEQARGTWYYTTDGGSTWNPVGAVSGSASLLLKADSDTRLYFAPAANFNGSVDGALTIRAWDQSSGSAGSKVSTATSGGSSAFSSAIDVVGVSVTPVADAPTSALASVSLPAVAEDAGSPTGQLVGVL